MIRVTNRQRWNRTKGVVVALQVSEPTARKIIDSRPDCFRRIRRGIWECRDPQADRQAEKGK